MFKLTVLSKLLFPAAPLNVWRKRLHCLIDAGSASRSRMSLQNVLSETLTRAVHQSNYTDQIIMITK